MSSFYRVLVVGLVSAGILGGSEQATAGLIFSENFSTLTGTVFLPNEPSERGSGDYLSGNASATSPITLPAGWVFEGDPVQIYGFDHSGDKAVILNEFGTPSNGISRTISGLLPSVLHTLTFEYWGDNVDANYAFVYEISGVVTPITASHSGQSTGNFHTEVFSFTPATTTTLLRFGETSTTTASPILDNISISAVPEPSSFALLSIGIVGLVAYARCRRRTCRGSHA